VRDALQSYLTLAGGLTEVTRQRALAAAKALAAQGEATAEQVQSLAEDLLSQTRQNSETVTALVRFEVERALGRLGLASGDDVTQLVGRVAALEEQVRSLRVSDAGAPAVKAPAKNASGEKAPAKKAPATKAPAKKAPATKAPAKKAPATKAPSKKSAAKKAPARASEAPATAPAPPPSTASVSPTSGS
jgi:polyhydroxyalkanoate synthesis regulator phasin